MQGLKARLWDEEGMREGLCDEKREVMSVRTLPVSRLVGLLPCPEGVQEGGTVSVQEVVQHQLVLGRAQARVLVDRHKERDREYEARSCSGSGER